MNMENEGVKRPRTTRLKNLRTRTGLNAKEAAEALGVPYSTYKKWENGWSEPKRAYVVQMAMTIMTGWIEDELRREQEKREREEKARMAEE